MGKVTRYDRIIASRTEVLTKDDNYTITEADILKTGYSVFAINGAYTLTLPPASQALAGVEIKITGNNANSKVAVAAGFNGGGSAWDTVTLGAYGSKEFWCCGLCWNVINATVAAS